MIRRHRILDILLYLIFACYLFILLAILFRTKHSFRSLNLIPFRTIHDYITGGNIITRAFALSNVLGNIVIFVPLGVYFALFSRRAKWIETLLWVFLFSMIVEIIQYIFRLGIGDIDDIILNVFGGAVGLVLYKIIWIIFKDKDKVRNIIAICAPIGGILSFALLIFINR